jgi:hypothetical protein
VREPRLRRDGDGALWIENLDIWMLAILHGVPSLLGRDQPEVVRRRLYPYPGEDEETREDWERHVHPDLFALLASARDIVLTDLAAVVPGKRAGDAARMRIPVEHRSAWISALQSARLALGALHDLDADDMEQEQFEEWGEREEAVARVHVLGWVLGSLIEDGGLD